jgi:AmiR/NasT family two-component response regulator
VHERERRRVSQLTQALEVRPQIDRAVGIMMSRTAKSPEQALNSLRQMSNTRHVKVATLADEVVDEAVRRARQRRTVRSDKQESSPSSHGV